MKNVVTVFALLISVTGVVVSLAREEARCYLGLQSNLCQPTNSRLSPEVNSDTPNLDRKTKPSLSHHNQKNRDQTVETPPSEDSVSTSTSEREKESPAPGETPSPQTKPPEGSSPPTEVSDKRNQTVETTPPSREVSQPIEVTPPSPETSPSQSQPIEVIPPPAQEN